MKFSKLILPALLFGAPQVIVAQSQPLPSTVRVCASAAQSLRSWGWADGSQGPPASLTSIVSAVNRQLRSSEGRLTQEEIAQRVGKSRPAVANALRLLALPEPVKAQVETGELSAGHARAVLSVDPAEQASFAREIAVAGVSKREAESRAAARRPRLRPTPVPAAPPDLQIRAVAEELTRDFGTRVRIVRRGRGGAIEIEFYSDPELDRLVHRLRAAGPSPAAML